MTRSTVAAIGIALTAVTTQSAAAQNVRGVVRVHETAVPVEGAALAFTRLAGDSATLSTNSDSTGVFFVRLSTRGAWRVDVRHPGFRPVTQTIDVAGGQEVVLEVRLSPVALEPIQVVSRRRNTRDRIGGYYDRLDLYGRLGIGRFMTREEIDRIGPGSPTDFLVRMPMVHVRGTGAIRVPLLRRHGQLCSPRIYFDGFQVGAADLDMMYTAMELEGIEIYRGPAQSPGIYNDPNGCGVILLWSRRDQRGGVEWLRGRRGVIAMGVLLVSGWLIMQ